MYDPLNELASGHRQVVYACTSSMRRERERERKGTEMIAVLSMKSDGWLNTADNDERGEAITAAAIVRRLA